MLLREGRGRRATRRLMPLREGRGRRATPRLMPLREGRGRRATPRLTLWREGRGRCATPRSESADSFLRVPARPLERQVCGLVAAPPVKEAAAYSRSPRVAP